MRIPSGKVLRRVKLGLLCLVVSSFSPSTYGIVLDHNGDIRAVDQISISIVGSGRGVVTGPGINCSSGTCIYSLDENSTVTLTAVTDDSNPGFTSRFDGWGKDCSEVGTSQCEIPADSQVSARFICTQASLPAGRRTEDEVNLCENLSASTGVTIAPNVSVEMHATQVASLGPSFVVEDSGVLRLNVGPDTPSAATPPVDITVDVAAQPTQPTIPGIDGGPVRNLLSLHSDVGKGYQVDFVENEIYLITDQSNDLDGFMSRWPSTLLFQIDVPATSADPTPATIYLLNVDASSADTTNLNEMLSRVDSKLYGLHRVTSGAGLDMLALVASEILDHGLSVGINVILESQNLPERTSVEAVIGQDVTVNDETYNYNANAFDWPYMRHDPDHTILQAGSPPLDTGIAEALRVVEASGRFDSPDRVKVLIADAGYYPNADFPVYEYIGPLRQPNSDSCGGSGGPVCAAHGTHVALTGFAKHDNWFGTVGAGGAVSKLTLLQSPSPDVLSYIRYIFIHIPTGAITNPDIVNISAGTEIPAGLYILVGPPLELLTLTLDALDILVVAAAGNDNYNVDAEDGFCFIFCFSWEESATIPCELESVFCVGANQFMGAKRADYSNYGTDSGSNSVDLYAPGNVYSVTALAADSEAPTPVDDLKVITGTSFAAPVAAGTIALVLGANPSFDEDDAVDCILSSAHDNSGPRRPMRTLNALGAVQCAMGGTHPYVSISYPASGAIMTRAWGSLNFIAEADDLEDGSPLTVNWDSSIDGSLGQSASDDMLRLGPEQISVGQHTICAEVTDTSNRTSNDCIFVQVNSPPPVVSISSPHDGDRFIQSYSIPLLGTAEDPDQPEPSIRWYIETTASLGTPVATGTLDTTIPASNYTPGDYIVTLVAEDDYGGTDSASVNISIDPVPVDYPPEINISLPTQDQEVWTDLNGEYVELSATASDPEDGAISFDQINWFVSIQDGPEQPLAVNSVYTCLEWVPTPYGDVCVKMGYKYYVYLSPAGSPTTKHVIKGRVTDSGGQENLESNGRVTVWVKTIL